MQHVHVANMAGVVDEYNTLPPRPEREVMRQEEGEGEKYRWGHSTLGGPQSQPYEANYGGAAGGPRQQASEGQRLPAVCTGFLYNQCGKGDQCRFAHPSHLAGAMMANAPQRSHGGGSTSLVAGGPKSTSTSPEDKTAGIVGKKRQLVSTTPQKGAKIRFGKAYEASYTNDYEDDEGEQQQEGNERRQEEQQEGEQEWE